MFKSYLEERINGMNVVIFSITCFVFLLLFVGLPIVGITCLIINFVENRRNKRYLDWIKRLDKLNNEHIHHTR